MWYSSISRSWAESLSSDCSLPGGRSLKAWSVGANSVYRPSLANRSSRPARARRRAQIAMDLVALAPWVIVGSKGFFMVASPLPEYGPCQRLAGERKNKVVAHERRARRDLAEFPLCLGPLPALEIRQPAQVGRDHERTWEGILHAELERNRRLERDYRRPPVLARQGKRAANRR